MFLYVVYIHISLLKLNDIYELFLVLLLVLVSVLSVTKLLLLLYKFLLTIPIYPLSHSATVLNIRLCVPKYYLSRV